MAENAGHFRLLGLVGGALAALAGFREPVVRRVGLLLLLAHAAPILSYSMPVRSDGGGAAGPTLRIAYANLGWPRDRVPAPLLEWIARENPDVVVLTEYDPQAAEALASLASTRPHRIEETRTDRFGMAVFSRVPLADSSLLVVDDWGVPAILVAGDSPAWRLWLLHPLPPSTPEQRTLRDQYLGNVAALVERETGPTIVVGDINTTERSAGYARLEAAGLRDARRGRGWSPSWPSFKLSWRGHEAWLLGLPFAIPIDHVFTRGTAAVTRREFGPPFGSDHLPILLEAVIPVVPPEERRL